MKKYLILLLSLTLTLVLACKKEEKKQAKDESVATKYAKFDACAYETDEMKGCVLALSKAEPVDFFATVEKTIKNKKVTLAKIQTSDGKKLFMYEEHLADKVIVFTEDVSPYTRNNLASPTYGEIPKGSIGFVMDEKGSWSKIYVGKIKDKWIVGLWVTSGFSADSKLISDALQYERAIAIFNKIQKQTKVAQGDIDKAKKTLNELSGGQNIFTDLAKESLKKWDEADKKQTDETNPDKKAEDKNPTDKTGDKNTGQ